MRTNEYFCLLCAFLRPEERKMAMQQTKNHLRDKLFVVGWLILACYVLRLWPFVLALLVVGIVMILRAVIKYTERPQLMPLEPVPVRKAMEMEEEQTVYAAACQKVSELVAQEYPGARWVWESADAKKKVNKSLPMHILLNQAGGYRQARIVLLDGRVIALRFESSAEETEEPMPDNYNLLAFQWVDANAYALEERCAEANRSGITDLILPEAELPVRESWQDICTELRKQGFPSVRAMAEGIRIDTTKELIQRERAQ